jgi:nucleotide-binding universal stress UspA family protein
VNQNTHFLPLHRILIPLDASENSMSALDTAADLAAVLGAELEGLFVEDINVLQLCEFPFAREVSFLGPGFRRIDRAETERQLRIQAQRLQKILSEVASRFHVPWKFRVTRGGVPAEVLAAAERADLTIMGRSGRSMTGRRRVGSTVRTVISKGKGMTLIIEQGMYFQPPVQVVFTGSRLSEKALALAVDLGRKKSIPVVVLVAGEPEEQEKLQERARDLIPGRGEGVSLHILPQPLDLGRINQSVRLHGPGPLFVPCEKPQLHGESLQDLVDAIQNPVLLVRSREGG